MNVAEKTKTKRYRYLEVAEDISKKIESGIYKKGMLLPSQNELIAHYNIALATARQALNKLHESGYIESFRGKGTYVREKPPVAKWEKKSFIGLALLDVSPGIEPIPHDCFMELHNQVHAEGKELLLRWLGSDQNESLRRWAEKIDVAVLYNGVTKEAVDLLVECGKKVIVVGDMKDGSIPENASWFNVSSKDVALTALEFLYGMNHSRIKLICRDNHGFGRGVIKAYNEFTSNMNIESLPVAIYQDDSKDYNQKIIEDIKREKVDSIFCLSSDIARATLKQLQQANIRVPEDISLLTGECTYRSDDVQKARGDYQGNAGASDNISAIEWASRRLFKEAFNLALTDDNGIYHKTFSPRIAFGGTVKNKV